jgi:signal recognition particle subunit SRP54
MFEILTEKLNQVLNNLGKKGRLSEKDIDAALREIRIALLEADVNFKVVKHFLEGIREKALSAAVLESLTPAQQIVKIVNAELTAILGTEPVRLNTANQTPPVMMLVGLQGSGKTTTAAKMAQNIKQAGQRPMLVAADTRRPAAVTQLVTLGKQLDVPVYQEDISVAPLKICQAALKKAREMGNSWVIIDTQGRLHIDEDMMKELAELKKEIRPAEVLLVVDAMTGQDAIRIAEEFNRDIGLTGIILTKMDGDARGGAALSIRFITGLPIKYIGVGEKTSALEIYYPDRLASRILGMGDVLSLVEKAEQTFDKERMSKLEKKMRKDELDLNDFLEQLSQVKKMGPLSNVLEMIPGFNKLPSNLLDGNEDGHVKKIEAIIFSMTQEERLNPDIINGSRRKRIAQGSGTVVRDVNQLINQFYQMKKMTKLLSKGKMPDNIMKMLR